MSDTIFALSTGLPPAAIAVIRVSGPSAHSAGELLAGTLPPVREAGLRVLRQPATNERLDDALVLRFDAPNSATGEDVIEFHCHGSRAVVDAVLGALATMDGARAAEPGEFTRRAFENGRIDLTEAEGLADLLEAETEAQRRAALLTAEGGLRRQIELWQAQLIELSARAERAIDYVDEDGDADGGTGALAESLVADLDRWLARPRVEPLRDGLRIVVAGPPNAGKSSLINAIAEDDRVIVSDIPGTTRDVVETPIALSGLPFVFADTAGLRETEDHVESIGVKRADAQIRRADILLWLGKPSAAPAVSNVILVHAKSDLGLPIPPGSVAVSAKTKEGLSELLALLIERARSLLPVEGAVAINRRQAAALKEVRESLAEAIAVRDDVIRADSLRLALSAIDRLTGRAGVEDVLDALFGRFCLGK